MLTPGKKNESLNKDKKVEPKVEPEVQPEEPKEVKPERKKFSGILTNPKIEKAMILYALNKCNFNKQHTADMRGTTVKTLYNKMHYYGWNIKNLPVLTHSEYQDMFIAVDLINEVLKGLEK